VVALAVLGAGALGELCPRDDRLAAR
jgi:hypothetical protein